MTHITQSVGLRGMNLPVDTNYIQRLLNRKLTTTFLRNKLTEDGDCGRKTQNAIRDFQQFTLKLAHPDSLIEPNKNTYKKLIEGIPTGELTKIWNDAVKAESKNMATSGGRIQHAEQTGKPLPVQLIPLLDEPKPTTATGKLSFPLAILPSADYHTGGRAFGANRDGRKHAGCDLIAPPGTPVCAIADGVIRAKPYYFYHGSYALEVVHKQDNLVVRYGELIPTYAVNSLLNILPEIDIDEEVEKGQVIGYVAKMTGGSSMLHFECYGNTSLTEGLTLKGKAGGKFKRRSDLLNPTNLLDGAKNTLPEKPQDLDNKALQNAIKFGHAQAAKKGF